MNTRNCQNLKHRPKVARLRKELATVIRRIRAIRQQPKPDVHKILCEAARRGLRGEAPIFDIGVRSVNIPCMTAPAELPSFAKLASAYGVSRQRLGQLAVKHGRETVHDPDLLFAAILTTCNSVLMRLADPGERARIKGELSKITP